MHAVTVDCRRNSACRSMQLFIAPLDNSMRVDQSDDVVSDNVVRRCSVSAGFCCPCYSKYCVYNLLREEAHEIRTLLVLGPGFTSACMGYRRAGELLVAYIFPYSIAGLYVVLSGTCDCRSERQSSILARFLQRVWTSMAPPNYRVSDGHLRWTGHSCNMTPSPHCWPRSIVPCLAYRRS